MPIYDTTVTVPHAAENMFELVSDIARYPEFIKWIRSMKVMRQPSVGHTQHTLGDARVGFASFTERFATNVQADPQNLTVQVDLVRGPFRRLHNFWTFHRREDGQTNVEFHIDYEFSNIVLRVLAQSNFDLAVNRIMTAFLTEADRRYERTGPPRQPA